MFDFPKSTVVEKLLARVISKLKIPAKFSPFDHAEEYLKTIAQSLHSSVSAHILLAESLRFKETSEFRHTKWNQGTVGVDSLFAVARVNESGDHKLCFEFKIDEPAWSEKAIALCAHCYNDSGNFLGGPERFVLSESIGFYQYIPGRHGHNVTECIITPPSPADTAYIVFHLIPWNSQSIHWPTGKAKFLAFDDNEKNLKTLVQGPHSSVSADILLTESLHFKETSQFRRTKWNQGTVGGDSLFAVARVNELGDHILHFEFGIDEPAGSEKAIALRAHCYNDSGNFLGGPERFVLSESIGFYQYVPGRHGHNVKDFKCSPPPDTAYIVFHLIPWDILSIHWPTCEAEFESWERFVQRNWATLFDDLSESETKSGIFLYHGKRCAPIRHIEQFRHIVCGVKGDKRLQLIVDPTEIMVPFRDAAAGFFSTQFLQLMEFFSVAIENQIPCDIRSSDEILRTIPPEIAEHPQVSLTSFETE